MLDRRDQEYPRQRDMAKLLYDPELARRDD
jgi:hypothetical protein